MNIPSNTPLVTPNQAMPPIPLPTSGLAIASLICGIVGWILVPVFGAIAAIVLGNMARKQTRATPPEASGDGMATAGIVLGSIQLALVVLSICVIAVLMILGPVIGNSFSTINQSLSQ